MTINDQRVLSILQEMAERGPRDPTVGICSNFEMLRCDRDLEIAGDVHEIFCRLWKSWPYFTGDDQHPVPAPALYRSPRLPAGAWAALSPGEQAHRVYWETTHVWEGEYGARRQELLNHMIAELEAAQSE